MVKTKFILIILMALALLYGTAHADRSIGFNYTRIIDDTGWGGNINLPITLDADTHVDIHGNAQGSDLIRARVHASITRDMGAFDISLYSDSVVKGASVASLGRQTDIGATVGVKTLSALGIQIGIFGRNGGAFASRNAYDDLLSQGYGEADLEAIDGLASLNPAPTGLSFQDKNSVNLLILGKTQLPLGVDLKFRVMPELLTIGTSEGEPVDQAILTFTTKRAVTEKIDLVLSADVGLQRFRESGTVETETSGGVSVQVPF